MVMLVYRRVDIAKTSAKTTKINPFPLIWTDTLQKPWFSREMCTYLEPTGGV